MESDWRAIVSQGNVTNGCGGRSVMTTTSDGGIAILIVQQNPRNGDGAASRQHFHCQITFIVLTDFRLNQLSLNLLTG